MNSFFSSRSFPRLALLLSTAFFIHAAPGAELSAVWNGPGGNGGNGNYNSAGDWSGGVVPNNGADTYNVFIDGGKAANSIVTLNSIFPTINTLSIGAGDGLIVDGTQLRIVGGSVVNDGSITLQNSPFALNFVGDMTLSGSGVLTIADTTTSIAAATSTDRLTNAAGHTIRGRGSLGSSSNPLTLTNQGLIDASSFTSGNLTIRASATGVINTGIMQASPDAGSGFSGNALVLFGNYDNTGGTIQSLTTVASFDGVQLQSGAAITGGTIQSAGNANARLLIANGASVSGATIKALDGSVLRIQTGTTITGGELQTGGGGLISVFDNDPNTTQDSATFDGITNSGAVQIADNTLVALIGSMTNNGNISFAGTTFSGIAVQGSVTLGGSGAVTLSHPSHNLGAGTSAADSLTNGADHAIQGRGQVSGLISNLGLVNANSVSGVMFLQPHANGLANDGILEATSGGTLTINSFAARTVTNNGAIQAIGAGSRVNVLTNITVDGAGEWIADGGTIDLLPSTGSAPIINTTGPITARNAGVFETGGQAITSTLATTESGGQLQLNGGSLGGGSIDNRGQINTTGAVTIGSNLENGGSVNAGSGSTVTMNGDVHGTGSFSGQVQFGATFSPGDSPANVFLQNVDLLSSSTLVMELAGTTFGTEYDRLTASGIVSIQNGVLDINLVSGFNPAPSDTFTIISGTIAGGASFSNAPNMGGIGLLADPNATATVQYNGDSIVLTNVQFVPEPSTWAMWSLGLGLLLGVQRLRRKL